MTRQEIRTRLRVYKHRTLDQSADKIVETAKRIGTSVFDPIPLPTERSLYTITRATRKCKDPREQFEIRTHRRLIDVMNPTSKTIDALMKPDLPFDISIEIRL